MMPTGRSPSTTSRSRSPVANPLHPKIRGNPVARVFKGDVGAVRRRRRSSRTSATTYRLTEHFHYWTKHVQINAVLQPSCSSRSAKQLAKEKGISTATG